MTTTESSNREKKNILLVDQGIGFGGSLVVIARLATFLDPSRFRPIIVSAMAWDTIRNHVPPSIATYRVKPIIDYVRRDHVVSALRWLRCKPLFKLCVYVFSVIEIPLNFASVLRMAAIIFREKVDLIHINNSAGAILAARITCCPAVWHCHGWQDGERREVPRFLRRVAHFISISHYITGLVVADGVPPERITTIHNSVAPRHRWLSDAERKALRTSCGFEDSHCVVTIVGRVIEWKGQIQLLQAMELVLAKAPHARVLVVGDDDEGFGNYPATVKDYASSHLPPDTAFFAGYQPDVDSYYQISDIVIHASISPEPFGLVITEAMQNAKPVVGASSGAVPEIISDGVDGFLVDPMDREQFADRIVRLAIDASLRRSFGQNGQQKIRDKFDPGRYACSVAAIYDQVLKGKAGR